MTGKIKPFHSISSIETNCDFIPYEIYVFIEKQDIGLASIRSDNYLVCVS